MDRKKIVQEIFTDFFGDNFVDFQGNDILVHFPHLTVTNENDRSVDISHLFAKVSITNDGKLVGRFQLNRSEYTYAQFKSDYAHSHLPGINMHNFEEFRTPCLGHGPLVGTCNTLNVDFDEDIWNLFCLELSKYVTRESLTGIPYRKLENIGVYNENGRARILNLNFFMDSDYLDYSITRLLDDFTTYILRKKPFEFNFVGDSYSVAISPYKFIVIISNLFIEWYNQLPLETQDRVEAGNLYYSDAKILDSKIYIPNQSFNSSFNRILSYVGRKVCVFKGIQYRVEITDITTSTPDENVSIIVKPSVAKYILNKILKIVNFKYGRNQINGSVSNTFTTRISENARIL